MTRRFGKRDRHHREIMAALRQIGCSVISLADLGQGCPDILVGHAGRTYGPYEIKSPGGKLTSSELDFWQTWRGGGKIIYTAEDVLEDMEMLAGNKPQ